MQADYLVNIFQGPGYTLFLHMQRISEAYLRLTNADTAEMAKTALKELRAAAGDCEKLIRNILHTNDCPDYLVLNVNKFAERNWTLDVMSGYLVNASHYLARFIHTPSNEGKVKELTAMYYLIRDLSECALEVNEENYRRELTE